MNASKQKNRKCYGLKSVDSNHLLALIKDERGFIHSVDNKLKDVAVTLVTLGAGLLGAVFGLSELIIQFIDIRFLYLFISQLIYILAIVEIRLALGRAMHSGYLTFLEREYNKLYEKNICIFESGIATLYIDNPKPKNSAFYAFNMVPALILSLLLYVIPIYSYFEGISGVFSLLDIMACVIVVLEVLSFISGMLLFLTYRQKKSLESCEKISIMSKETYPFK